jgi:hypothetical protein
MCILCMVVESVCILCMDVESVCGCGRARPLYNCISLVNVLLIGYFSFCVFRYC